MINRLISEISQVKNVKAFPYPPGSSNIVSSTPLPNKSVAEAFNFSWPSPIVPGRSSELQHTEKYSEEKTQQCHESQELRSKIPVAGLLKMKVQKFTKLSVIPDTDEEDEDEEIVPHRNTKNFKSVLLNKSPSKTRPSLHVQNNKSKQREEVDAAIADTDEEDEDEKMAVPYRKLKNSKSMFLNKSPSKRRPSLHVRNNKSKQRKKIEDKKSKEATNSQKKTRKSLAPRLHIQEESEHDIIEDQRQGTQDEHPRRNKNNAYKTKQSEKPVKLDNKINPEQKKDTATVQTGVIENKQNEEKDETVLIPEEKQEKQSLRKTRPGRLNPSQQHTDTVNIQDIAPETELPAVTQNTEEDRGARTLKSPQENQSMEHSKSGKESHTSSASRKRSLFSHEKTPFSIIENTVSTDSSKKLAYYSFLEEEKDCAPKRKRKFNSKEKITGDLRRSKRTRVKPLAYWTGERLCYKVGADLCFEIVGVEPACNAERNYRQRNTEYEQIVLHIPLHNKENPELKKVQIINEGKKQDVECFSTLRPESVSQEFSKYKMLDGAVTETGLMKLASSTKKSFQASPAHYVFFILKGHALVQIHNTTQQVKPGEVFQVPKGISYSIENLSEKQMVLHFVMVK